MISALGSGEFRRHRGVCLSAGCAYPSQKKTYTDPRHVSVPPLARGSVVMVEYVCVKDIDGRAQRSVAFNLEFHISLLACCSAVPSSTYVHIICVCYIYTPVHQKQTKNRTRGGAVRPSKPSTVSPSLKAAARAAAACYPTLDIWFIFAIRSTLPIRLRTAFGAWSVRYHCPVQVEMRDSSAVRQLCAQNSTLGRDARAQCGFCNSPPVGGGGGLERFQSYRSPRPPSAMPHKVPSHLLHLAIRPSEINLSTCVPGGATVAGRAPAG